MSQVELITNMIHHDQQQIEGLRIQIAVFYQQINDGLAASNGIITKEIENKYKEIDSAFNKKSKYEQNVTALKRRIFSELGIA